MLKAYEAGRLYCKREYRLLLLLTLGALFAIGLLADLAGRFSFLPRVSILIIAGIAAGPSLFELIPAQFVDDWFSTLTAVSLSMIGFLLGQGLTLNEFRARGVSSVWLAAAKVTGSILAVFAALSLAGIDTVPALLLAGIAAATDPAATVDVIREISSKGTFTRTLLRVVAIDDAVALIAFAFLMAAAGGIGGWQEINSNIYALLGNSLLEVAGSIALGCVLGVPMAYLTGRIESYGNAGEPIMAEALGFVLICAGLADVLGLSEVLAAMTMGSVVASLAKHQTRTFAAIEGIEWPFMILFFLLAGASVNLNGIAVAGGTVAFYLVARSVGAYAGVYFVASRLRSDPAERNWLGLALLPQAGIAIGMALIASQAFPEHAELLLTCTLLSTVILEVAAPVVTRLILKHVGDAF